MKLFKTGISGLDEFLKGGLPPNVILLIGSPGSGSRVFAEQILYNRSLEGKVTYFTVNKDPRFIMDEMKVYGWDVSKIEGKNGKGKWRFKSLTNTKTLADAILREMKQNRWITLDSLSELLLKHDTQEILSIIESLSSNNIKSEGLHFLLLTEGMHEPKVETALQHYADSVIRFAVSWESEVFLRTIMIKKMRGAIAPTRSIIFSLSNTGLTIETARRIT